MEKSKRKGKPNRWRGFIIIIAIAFCGCPIGSLCYYLNALYQAPYSARIDEAFLDDIAVDDQANDLIKERLQEHLAVGESTQNEVQDFVAENMTNAQRSCHWDYCMYYIFISHSPICDDGNFYIRFDFEENILSNITVGSGWACF